MILAYVLTCIVIGGGTLLLVVKVYLLFGIVLTLCVLLGSCLTNLILSLHFRYLSTCEDAADTVVHIVNHRVEQLGALKLEDEQRILLLVRSILHTVTEFVKQTQVLLPCIVDDVQHYHAFKLLYNVLCLCAVSLLEIARNIVYTLAVGDRHHDALIYCTLVLLYLLDDRPSNTLDTVGLALECSHCALEGALLKVFTLCIVKLFLAIARILRNCSRHPS